MILVISFNKVSVRKPLKDINILKDISTGLKMPRGRKSLKDFSILKDILLKDIRLPCNELQLVSLVSLSEKFKSVPSFACLSIEASCITEFSFVCKTVQTFES